MRYLIFFQGQGGEAVAEKCMHQREGSKQETGGQKFARERGGHEKLKSKGGKGRAGERNY
jgi:hypothetical protein